MRGDAADPSSVFGLLFIFPRGESMFHVTETASELIAAYVHQHKWPHAIRIVVKAG